MTDPAAEMGSAPSGRGPGQRGITLVEVLVALVVTALALAIAGGSFHLLARSGDRGAFLIARHEALSRGIDVLRHDIERLERIASKRDDGAGFVFQGDAGRLAFVVVEPAFPSQAGPYVVVYTIQQRRDGAVLTRERAPFDAPAVDLGRLQTGDSVAVLDGPYRLRFLYLEHKAGRERWVAQWPDSTSIPELVSLELSGLAGRDAMPIVFRPRIDAERSCVKEDGGSCTIGTRGVLAPKSEAGNSLSHYENTPEGRN